MVWCGVVWGSVCVHKRVGGMVWCGLICVCVCTRAYKLRRLPDGFVPPAPSLPPLPCRALRKVLECFKCPACWPSHDKVPSLSSVCTPTPAHSHCHKTPGSSPCGESRVVMWSNSALEGSSSHRDAKDEASICRTGEIQTQRKTLKRAWAAWIAIRLLP